MNNAQNSRPHLALFDLDNTLLSGDSDYEWAQFLIAKGAVDKELQEAKNSEFYEHYKAGTLDIDAFLDFQLAPLARHERAELDRWHAEFIRTRIAPLIGTPARALVNQHLKAGDLCVIVTATNSFITGPIAQLFDIPHLIATIPAVDAVSGRFNGKPAGTPSFQAGKITRVEAWLAERGHWWGSFGHSYFYSDSMNDLPLMKKVSHPVAVDPDAKLLAHAQTHGWPVISLR